MSQPTPDPRHDKRPDSGPDREADHEAEVPGDDNPETPRSAEGESAPTQQEPEDGTSATGTTSEE